VRGAAIQALGLLPSVESLQALVVATGDEFRVVRVRAAAGIAAFPKLTVPPAYQAQLKKANDEYLASITARPDQWTSHYNMGNYLLGRGELQSAVASYQTALKLDPHATMAMVNTSIAHARMGENDKAEKALQMALKQAPDSAVANFNMGLLKAGKNELNAAETYLKNALTADPQMAQAAYNLCIITAKDRIGEAVTWCRKASDLRPLEPKYAYTLAFYLNQMGDKDAAVKILRGILEKNPQRKDAELLLGELSN
jgi:tetratricopeptide (TPR) repeat protein